MAGMVCAPGYADLEVSLSPESLYLGEVTTLRVRMSGSDISRIGRDDLELSGLRVLEGPWTSSEYRWTNGRATRSRIVEFLLSGETPGTAAVTVTLPGSGLGRRITRTAVVSPSPASSLRLSGRGPWIVGELSSDRVFEGEQLIATWSVISETTGRSVMQEIPDLDGFFVEELAVDEEGVEPFSYRGRNYLRWPIKRYALVPLRSGTRTIGAVEALVPTRRVSSWLEGLRSSLDTTARVRSGTMQLEVVPRPEGVDLIGAFAMDCALGSRDGSGPVRIDVTVRGLGNLRSARPPRFAEDPGIVARPVSEPAEYRRKGDGVEMEKSWTWLLFPAESGELALPPLELRYYDPAREQTRVARCGGWSVEVDLPPGESSAAPPLAGIDAGGAPAGEVSSDSDGGGSGSSLPVVAAASMIALSGIIALVWLRGLRERAREAAKLHLLVDNPALLRQRLDAIAMRKGWIPRDLLEEPGEEGDAWRSVISSLDLIEREPWAADEHRERLRERLAVLVARL